MSIVNAVTFSPLKAIARKVLSCPAVINNPGYQFFYQRRMKRMMAECEIKPHRVVIEGTNWCSARCPFCPHEKMTRPKGCMPMALFEDIADQVKTWGVHELKLEGFGEPLVDTFFKERIEYAKKIGIPKVQTNVNAIAIKESFILYLLNSGIDEIFISCNAAGEQNVRRLLAARIGKIPKIYLSFIRGYTQPYKGVKADGVSYSYPHDWGGAVPHENKTPKTPCRLLWVSQYINWQGKVFLCCMDYDCKYIIGDATKEKLRDIWETNYFLYRASHKHSRWDNYEICSKCAYNAHNKSPWWV